MYILLEPSLENQCFIYLFIFYLYMSYLYELFLNAYNCLSLVSACTDSHSSDKFFKNELFNPAICTVT